MREQYSQLAGSGAQEHPQESEAIQFVAELQTELDELRQQLAWSNRLSQLGVLTANLAHELRNQLTPIQSYAQLALTNPDNAQLNERALRSTLAASGKANDLINRVLELASPGHREDTKTCKINEVVENAFACMQPRAKQLGVNLISEVEPSVAAIDALSLEQVLINLIANACQAMSDQKGRRQVLLETDESNGRLQILVRDTGPGIPERIREKMFEPFASFNASDRERDRQGTGLGLSICKQLVAGAGGQIVLCASSEEGSTFRIDVPTPGQSS